MPPFTLPAVPEATLDVLSSKNRLCIERLLATSCEIPDLSGHPETKLGAVLILLYEDAGELRVLLTTRSKTLRTHPGETALPGGRVDATDASFIDTAYREAQEEVGLPRSLPDIHTIAILDPAISGHKIVVLPVVSVLTRPSILNELKAEESEVACIFTHPLRAVLDPTVAKSESLVAIGSEDWPYLDVELHNWSDFQVSFLDNRTYRLHRFRSSASPIEGLTAELLIKTAKIAFGVDPTYEQYAPGQLRTFKEINEILLGGGVQTAKSSA